MQKYLSESKNLALKMLLPAKVQIYDHQTARKCTLSAEKYGYMVSSCVTLPHSSEVNSFVNRKLLSNCVDEI